jgi:hypothetical protein
MLTWAFLAFANIKPPLKKKSWDDDITYLPVV